VETPLLKGGENHDLSSQDFNPNSISLKRSNNSDYKLLQPRNLTINPFPLYVAYLLQRKQLSNTIIAH